jgi:hypothetical protein
MVRETFKISSITNEDNPDNIEGFSVFEMTECDFDAEKGFVDYKCVAQRRSDGKFFAFKYTKYGYSGSDLLDQTMKEVFPVEKTITVYE